MQFIYYRQNLFRFTILNKLRETSYRAGVMSHLSHRAEEPDQPLLSDPTPGVPGREVVISLPSPKTAGILSPFLNPMREMAEDVGAEAAHSLDEAKTKATRVTSDPSTLPSFYPSAAMAVPRNFTAGYRAADKALDEERARKLDDEVESSRLEFEKALQEEYAGSRAKTAGELIDGLAQRHLTKEGEGELNQALGAYLALASLMGTGTHEFTRRWVEKRDPKRQEFKALQDAVKRRMQSRPLQVQIEAPELEPAPELSV